MQVNTLDHPSLPLFMSYRFTVKSVVPGLESKAEETSKTEAEHPDETPLSPRTTEAKLKVSCLESMS